MEKSGELYVGGLAAWIREEAYGYQGYHDHCEH